MNAGARLAVLAILSAPVYATLAAPTANQKIAPPEGFGVRLRGAVEPVVYARIEASVPNAVERKTFEAICAAGRKVGSTTKTPVFEAGWDQPGRIDTIRFTNERVLASFSVQRSYGCDPDPAAATKRHDPCGCTFKLIERRTSEIKTLTGGRLETLHVDFTRRMATRSVARGRAQPIDADAAETLAARLAPATGGTEEILGMTCAVHRQDMPGGGWREWCVTAKDDTHIHPLLRSRALRHATYGPDGKASVSMGDSTVEIEPEAFVDVGVFMPPDGVQIKEIGLAPGAIR